MASPYDVDIRGSSYFGSSGQTTTALRKRTKTGKPTGNPYNTSISVGDAPNTDYSKQAQDKRAGKKVEQKPPAKQPEPQRGQSLFDKVKNFGKEAVNTVKTDVQKGVNTYGALATGQVGLLKAGAQAVTGNKKAASKTLDTTHTRMNELLDKGAGGKGGIVSSKQGNTSGGGAKGLKENFVKPVAKGAAEFAPYAVPVIKGGSLLSKAMKSAGVNATQSAAVDAGSQLVDKGKVDVKQTAKSAALGGTLGAIAPGLDAAAGKAFTKSDKASPKQFMRQQQAQNLLEKARQAPNTVPQAILDELPQPGETIKPQAVPEDHAAHFNVTEKTKKVPVDSLKLSKSADDNIDSSIEAERRMQAASSGDMPKREPVLVHASPDGSHTVLDGNATATVAMRNGWKELPVDKVHSEVVPEPQHVEAAKTLIEQAHAENPKFQETIGGIAKNLGLEYKAGKPKGLGRSLSKIMNDYGGDASRIKDTIRGTLSLSDHSPAGIKKIIDTVEATYPGTKIKNLYATGGKAGYKDIKLTVTTEGGHKGEIILATPEMLRAKSELGGHALYAEAASTQDATKLAELEAQMTKLYAEAEAATNARLASSSVSSTPSTIARAGDTNGVPSGKSVADTAVPSESSRTMASSTSKKRGNESESVIPSTIAKNDDVVKHGGKEYQLSGEALEAYRTAKAIHADTVKTWAKDKSAMGNGRRKRASMELWAATKEIVNQGGKDVKDYVPTAREVPTPKPKPIKPVAKPEPTSKEPQRLTPTQTAHLETIGGYNHSSDMATEYADMLRGMDKQAKGGQLLPGGEGGYTRTSENSPFYRAYYKEHKKAPTKADYLEEATRQLNAGKDMYGAGDDYKALLEREAQPLPAPELDLPVAKGTGDTARNKLGSSVEQKAIAAKLTKGLGDLPQYSKVNMKQQAEDALALLAKDEQKAKMIALGQEAPPANLLPESVYTAVENKALKDGNIELITQLANSTRVGEATAMGQRIRALGERTPDSAVSGIVKLKEARVKAFETKQGTTATKAVSEEIRAIRQAKPKVVKETFESFVESLKC